MAVEKLGQRRAGAETPGNHAGCGSVGQTILANVIAGLLLCAITVVVARLFVPLGPLLRYGANVRRQRFWDRGEATLWGDVSAIFCLGDYCYTRDPDNTGRRAKQVGMFLGLLADWLHEEPGREAVVLLGNHELEAHYYASNLERAQVRDVVKAWHRPEGVYMPADPFRSFEIENGVDVTVYFSDQRRSFRLCHAVTREFVTALYIGLDDPVTPAIRGRIENTLGLSWLQRQVMRATEVRERWGRFLRAAPGSSQRTELVNTISTSLREEMQTKRIIALLQECGGDLGSAAAGYRLLVNEVKKDCRHAKEAFRSFWGPPAHIDAEYTGLEFARDLRRLYSSLGIGKMYSLCGHFHADLGLFPASEEFGTHMIAVGGLQPQKLIATAFSAYILACGDGSDVLYRLSLPDDPSVDESDYDLSCD